MIFFELALAFWNSICGWDQGGQSGNELDSVTVTKTNHSLCKHTTVFSMPQYASVLNTFIYFHGFRSGQFVHLHKVIYFIGFTEV